MKMGIVPGWLLAAVIANVIGEFPLDLCTAGAAIGIGLSVAAFTRSSTALSAACSPGIILVMRYIVLPPLSGAAPWETAWLGQLLQPLVSAPGLTLISLLSILGSYLAGLRYATTGEG
ncbi:hypothetical protein BLA39750_01056 [Burkholderia lata]|uniref:Uncharacterized protein n=1 Tax=Burkholderia lata (strain ATCC 17760 / DSM 23089 / LMG 22485 / NCIMB 9086 / R18194 / 383) TaxID=482957 RepID=A0A6P2VBH4_BURL3|nr:hypothetical protein [Burkholderia lata]VWC78959.1 hypothetical protein BLA39750_01056 [Burkholderia lata]